MGRFHRQRTDHDKNRYDPAFAESERRQRDEQQQKPRSFFFPLVSGQFLVGRRTATADLTREKPIEVVIVSGQRGVSSAAGVRQLLQAVGVELGHHDLAAPVGDEATAGARDRRAIQCADTEHG